VRALLKRKQRAYLHNPLQLASDLKNVQRDLKSDGHSARQCQHEVGKKDARLPDRTHYVKYTQGYLSRAIVDFDHGEITVETLDERNFNSSLKNAIVTTLLTPDDPRAVDLFRIDQLN